MTASLLGSHEKVNDPIQPEAVSRDNIGESGRPNVDCHGDDAFIEYDAGDHEIERVVDSPENRG